jgi:hypothetical protein
MVGSYSTESVVGSCAVSFLQYLDPSDDETSPLTSRVKQLFFLLGLMLSTPEPEQPKGFEKSEWNKAEKLLEEIFGAYAWMFWPQPGEESAVTDEWRDVREVAMPAFLHYFNTALLASVEQVSDRVSQYLAPFDEPLVELMGISATDALLITSWVAKSIQKHSDDVTDAMNKMHKARLALIDRAKKERWDEERVWQEARKDEVRDHMEAVHEGIQNFFKVQLESIANEFGTGKANAFWKLFVSRRGEVSDFKYLTERNVAIEKPLFELTDGVASCPLTNALFSAVLKVGEQKLLDSPSRDLFLKKRDKVLEREVEDKLRAFFPDSAKFFAGVYETPDLHYEHDLIVLWDKKLFVIEAKASPPVEPFRDPDRAFTRIKRAFQSDTGIQKAFEQANRIKRILDSGDTVKLYDSNQNLAVEIVPQDIGQTYLVCVTRDDFGPLAVDLSLLLEKEEEDSYPWAVNILDLESLLDAWRYFHWGPEKLCEYLDARIRVHGKIFTTDELDVAGFFIQHGGLDQLFDTEADRIVLNPEYSSVFSKIYMTRHGGDEVIYAPVKPVMIDMRKELFGENKFKMPPEKANGNTQREIKQKKKKRQTKAYKNKIGRGAPCPCQSGKTYSRCCGKKAA